MRICYIAKHGSGGNDDEGSVNYALVAMGHDVVCVHEDPRKRLVPLDKAAKAANLILFHHWPDCLQLRQFSIPKIFWCFDLIEWDQDPVLYIRSDRRRAWMRQAMLTADLGFCTDGDWVAKYHGKLHWLPQGADERVVGFGTPRLDIPILFTGISRGGGAQRESFVAEMMDRYGKDFVVVEKGCHGRAMADLVASARIVVAPDSPITSRYWSNRVYNVLGFGGFLLHPLAKGLRDLATGQFPGCGPMFYHDREHLHHLISIARNDPAMRQCVASAAHEEVKEKHLYRHRVAEMLAVAAERIPALKGKI